MERLIVLLLGFSLIGCATSSVIHGTDGTAVDLATPVTFLGPRTFNVSGTVVYAEPPDGCSPLTNNVTGKIVFVAPNKCYPYQKAKNVEDAGGIAVLLSGYRKTFGLLIFYHGPNDGSIDVPVVEVWLALDPPLQEGANVTVSPSPNPMVEFGPGIWTFYSVFLGALNLCVLVYAVRKFVFFVKQGTEGTSALPFLILGMVIATCLREFPPPSEFTFPRVLTFDSSSVRIPILIDPTGWNGIWTWGTIEFFLTLDYSPAVMCALVIALHWNSELRKAEKGFAGAGFNLSKKKYLIPVLVGLALLTTFEATTSSLRARLLAAQLFLVIKVIIYFGYSWFVGTYYIWNFKKILHIMHSGFHGNALTKKAWFAFGAGICLLLFGLTVWLVPTPMYNSPGGYFMLRIVTSIELLVSMQFLCILFEAKMKKTPTTKWGLTAGGAGTSLSVEGGTGDNDGDSDSSGTSS
jgi:hypothetical protein